jgi:formyltetrahydrofolate-dependent phosphoribosylglycinamide formyltransferase
MTAKTRAAILISGQGTNMAALIAQSREPDFPAEFAMAIADRECPGLAKASALGVTARAIPWAKGAGETEIIRALKDTGVDLVCLAGFMRLVSKEFIVRWPGRLLNIHPSLLPDFKGLDAIGQAFRARAPVTGVTVHHVIPEMDEGPTILRQAVPIYPSDTLGALETRIHRLEHELYPAAVRKVLA